ncbi:TetR/AcrR family transcriptional regulator [Nocardioides zeae]|uniref:TetR/AcrR family transcriptional regulator n=1 Tax=Nocardioides imazamoxiresistens TaxID=3231893 RepID=A0ABU3PUK7_9ACTN|nr:TetR/AcrR family transcriptional regulator [Nocardioides zeae]MDT9592915.1 TetR/AcrR family transcriptional regulator [Nocardioides zeae]
MSTARTPRQVARAETLRRIRVLALAQLAESGASELSLRAIARELGMVSSAIYRYYASRDELLTALIVEAYADAAAAVEAAGSTGSPRERWLAGAAALRAWARAEPHRFALVYGSAVPGYRAPADTVEPAGRVVRAFAAPVVAASPQLAAAAPGIATPLAGELAAADEALALDLDPAVTLWLVGAFARVVGLLTLELNGHFVGAFEPADALFAATLDREAAALDW